MTPLSLLLAFELLLATGPHIAYPSLFGARSHKTTRHDAVSGVVVNVVKAAGKAPEEAPQQGLSTDCTHSMNPGSSRKLLPGQCLWPAVRHPLRAALRRSVAEEIVIASEALEGTGTTGGKAMVAKDERKPGR